MDLMDQPAERLTWAITLALNGAGPDADARRPVAELPGTINPDDVT
jgi:hypothetical protein